MNERQQRALENQNLTTGSILRKLTVFALPILLGNIFTQLYNVADAIIVGRWVGSDALAAVGCSGSINMIMHSILIGLGMGVSVIVSQFFGAGKHEELTKAVNTTIILCLIFGAVLTVVGLLVGGPLLRLIKTPENILEDAILYLNITFLGLFGMMFYHIGSFVLRGIGDSKFPMYMLILSSILNVILNLLFVVVFNMGVAGVAWATIISQYLVAVAVLIRIFKLKICELNRKTFRISKEILGPIIRIGLPTSIQSMLTSLGMLILQRFNNGFGSDMVATVTVMQKLDGFANMPAMALGTAATTFVGQNIGARNFDRVKKGVRYVLTCNLIIGVTVGAAMLIFGRTFLHLFTTNEKVVEIGLHAISIISFGYIATGVQNSCAGIIRGAGASFVTMVIMLLCTVVRIPLAYILAVVPHRYTGIFWSILIASYLGAVLTFGYYLSGRWKNKGVVKAAPEGPEPSEAREAPEVQEEAPAEE